MDYKLKFDVEMTPVGHYVRQQCGRPVIARLRLENHGSETLRNVAVTVTSVTDDLVLSTPTYLDAVPAGEVVEIPEAREMLLNMIAVGESTPGPIGVNMATYVGFTVAGIPGSVIATIGLITPSVIIILIVARVLAKFRDSKLVKDLFYGLRPASAGLIAAAGFSVVVLALVDKAASGMDMIRWKGVLLAAILLVLTRKVKQTKDLHPVFFIALSALAGVLFSFAGV